jgi:hypothetical protein
MEIEKFAAPDVAVTQRMMDLLWQKEAKPGRPPQFTFQYALHSSRKAFETFRYVHEIEAFPTGEGWHGQPIMHAVRQRLISLRPAWKDFRFVGAAQPPTQPPTFPTL